MNNLRARGWFAALRFRRRARVEGAAFVADANPQLGDEAHVHVEASQLTEPWVPSGFESYFAERSNRRSAQ
jgi:hypothetical protein